MRPECQASETGPPSGKPFFQTHGLSPTRAAVPRLLSSWLGGRGLEGCWAPVTMETGDGTTWLYPALLLLLLLLLPGCCTAERGITGPRTVRGPEQGSLTVQCAYAASWKTYNKWWCQGARWSSCEILVETSAKEQKVRRGRVSITDDQTNFTIMVTMEDLRMSDADVYWCGIERTGIDLGVEVQVTIDPASEHLNTVMTTTVIYLSSTPSSLKTTNGDQPVTGSGPDARSLLSSVHFLLLVFLKVPLFLSMLSAVLWVNRPQRSSKWRESQQDMNQWS
ncbi:CMRF35-like molecule 5 [Dipodomys spectabilis]|uniref:CMRF35-like molecule 5 n=1 Tax=Dipodomys spectabilis TaxID=105255 RepID=UPI001C54191F|nr:CMRF35-like molecule 5 [Dipodomys spectabilis]